ncbi:hypothetical protein K435DRAFT_861230 [Dendrothele bispora CBS 962.96]|uniref:Uncharacterized protein n=1 Tax=Dendrothele bispora (strain CBS 962.96) TaxID=1314807 RepID=A0A4S8LVT9_DENBC|nr:hypothetical protein K435DRAFT_861230 [Dendrothele bispora CBS 962.96]
MAFQMTSLQGKACDLKSGSHPSANSQKDGGTHAEVSIRVLVQSEQQHPIKLHDIVGDQPPPELTSRFAASYGACYNELQRRVDLGAHNLTRAANATTEYTAA